MDIYLTWLLPIAIGFILGVVCIKIKFGKRTKSVEEEIFMDDLDDFQEHEVGYLDIPLETVVVREEDQSLGNFRNRINHFIQRNSFYRGKAFIINKRKGKK